MDITVTNVQNSVPGRNFRKRIEIAMKLLLLQLIPPVFLQTVDQQIASPESMAPFKDEKTFIKELA